MEQLSKSMCGESPVEGFIGNGLMVQQIEESAVTSNM